MQSQITKFNFQLIRFLKTNPYWNSRKVWVGSFLFLGFLSLIFNSQSSSESTKPPIDIQSADTFIPEGMVLIPIEIQNKDALYNIMGEFGMVDLYTPSFGTEIKSRKVASSVKIMRAPLNPEVYAVLVPEQDAFRITEFAGPFIVTIQNPKNKKIKFPNKTKKQKLEIVMETL